MNKTNTKKNPDTLSGAAGVSQQALVELIDILLNSCTFVNAPDHYEEHEHRLFGYAEREEFEKLKKSLTG